jgi:hypothetical protein
MPEMVCVWAMIHPLSSRTKITSHVRFKGIIAAPIS